MIDNKNQNLNDIVDSLASLYNIHDPRVFESVTSDIETYINDDHDDVKCFDSIPTTRAHLTNLLKKAQKMDWYGTDHWSVTFGFVYQHPAAVDWKYTGDEARALYLEITSTIDDLAYDDMRLEGYGINHRASIFTAYQSRILDL